MKKVLLPLAFPAFFFLSIHAHAQLFKKLKDKVSSKIESKVDNAVDNALDKGQVLDSTTGKAATTKSSDVLAAAAKTYDFRPGAAIVFTDDFSKDSAGSMAQSWKTSGSGAVGSLPDESGRWLLLKEFTSYKLKSNTPLPENFTVEFDIATQSRNDASDLNELLFGFAHDNAINDYTSDAYNENAITATTIHYWNKEIMNASSDTKINNTLSFPLAEYAVGKMHVAIAVKNQQMQVYLDKVKVLDTGMFGRDNEKKYFYISTGTKLSNGAAIGVSNFRIAGL